MGCETCKNDMTEEAKAVRAAQDMAQKYKLLCRAVAALVAGFIVMVGCMVWAVTNAQTIANEAVLKALETVAEMEVITETTAVTQDTGEGDGDWYDVERSNPAYDEIEVIW